MRPLRVFVLAAFALGFVSAALAQSYPSRPVKVIVPFPPGDAADVLSPLIGPKMADRMGQPLVVENRAGASGQIGMEILARSAPDGYTIGVGQGGTLSPLTVAGADQHTGTGVPETVAVDRGAVGRADRTARTVVDGDHFRLRLGWHRSRVTVWFGPPMTRPPSTDPTNMT